MRVFKERPVMGAATIVMAVSMVTGGSLAAAAPAASAAPGRPAGAASPHGTSYSVSGTLQAVAATSATNAWAVGTVGTASNPLIVHWNGSKWSSVPTGAPANTFLHAVAASSGSNAWALGEISTGSGRTVILHWNGRAWKQVSFTAPAGTYLASVSVTSPTNAWAVGNIGNPGTIIALHWNGSAWKRVPLPKLPVPAHTGTALNSVSATSAKDAWAVGAFVSQFAGPGTGFALHWNGASWTRVASAPAGKGDPVAVAATSPTNAWLIGCPCQGGPAGAVTGQWNGHAWKTVPLPVAKPPSGGDGTAIAAIGHAAWAAGAYTIRGVAMLLRWTGTAWKLTAVPNAKTISIAGVAVTTATNAWAVGTSTSEKTVILHWNGGSWH
jgi:hypothetical protein